MKRQLYHGITQFKNNNLYSDLFVKIGTKYHPIARAPAGECYASLDAYLLPPIPLRETKAERESWRLWLNVSKGVLQTIAMMSDEEATKYLESDDFEVPRV